MTIGWPIFPCHPETKRPLVHGGFHSATTDAAQIAAWRQQWPNARDGVPTGPASGFFVVDVDTIEGHGVDGVASWAALVAEHGEPPPTRLHRSPSGSPLPVRLGPDAAGAQLGKQAGTGNRCPRRRRLRRDMAGNQHASHRRSDAIRSVCSIIVFGQIVRLA